MAGIVPNTVAIVLSLGDRVSKELQPGIVAARAAAFPVLIPPMPAPGAPLPAILNYRSIDTHGFHPWVSICSQAEKQMKKFTDEERKVLKTWAQFLLHPERENPMKNILVDLSK